MDLDLLSRFLLYCLAVNYAFLFVWFVAFAFARGLIRRLHGRWFSLSDASFDAIHYGGMGLCKIGILIFNLAPLIALQFVR